MQDAIYVSNLQTGMDAYAGYVAGSWPTYSQMVARFPNSKHLSISPFASVQADCLDIETGDATVSQAAGWLAGWKPANTPLPVLYTSAGNVQNLINTLSAAGHPRSSYFIWSAHYNNVSHICGPGTCGYPQADATQWQDPGPYDSSLVPDTMFALSNITVAGVTVQMVQTRLNVWHANPQLVVDGAWGPLTYAAVLTFQKNHGLAQDGIVGPLTWDSLNSAPPAPTPPFYPSGSEASTVALISSPGTYHLFVVGTNGAIYYCAGATMAAVEQGAYVTLGLPNNLQAYSVSAAWKSDWSELAVVAHCTDGKAHMITWEKSTGKWGAWVVQAGGAIHPPVAGPPGPPGPTYNDTAIKAEIAALQTKVSQVAKDLAA